MSPDHSEPRHGTQVDSGFRPPWWLRNGHAQTMWAGGMRRGPAVPLHREPLPLPDGDNLQLHWGPPAQGPVVIVLHGLGGCAESPYVRGLVRELHGRGFQAVVMEFRGAGHHLNAHPRFFHAGAVEDVEAVVHHIHGQLPGRATAMVGFSMGGIMTLNWLGEAGSRSGVDAAVTVSAPLMLAECADYINTGLRRVYDRHLVRGLRQLVRRKMAQQSLPLAPDALRRARSLREFDDHVTGPLHGFRDSADYYARCSPARRLNAIRVPTKVIHALDDPFVPASSLPPARALAPDVCLEVSDGGGHVGFVTGSMPARPVYWLDTTIPSRLEDMLGIGHSARGADTRRPPDGGLLESAG